jgi:RNA polymerase sigma-70 factor (ECF subfamily)
MGGTFVSKTMKPRNPNFGPIYDERPHSSGHPHSPAEKQLLARARAGDQAAFGELCKRSEPRLLRMARHIVRNEEDARDAVQEALLNAFLNLSRFDERSSFFTWATRIAINSSLMQLRKRRPFFVRFTDDAPEDLAVKDPSPDPEALLAEKNEQRVLHEAIRSLPRKLRIVVELKQFRDCSLEETAAALSISRPAAKARFSRAKQMLRNRLLRDLRRRSVFRAEVITISRTERRHTRENAPTRIANVTPRSGLAEIA